MSLYLDDERPTIRMEDDRTALYFAKLMAYEGDSVRLQRVLGRDSFVLHRENGELLLKIISSKYVDGLGE